jgi:hypothetical protein
MSNPQMIPAGVFHLADSRAQRRQIFTGSFSVLNGHTVDYVVNNGGYAMVWVETILMAQHGSNGNMYRLDEISRYGHDPILSDGSFQGSITFASSIGGDVNKTSLRLTAATDLVANMHINVYYFNTETGTEVSVASGLTKIGAGV